MSKLIIANLEPIWEKREYFTQRPQLLQEILDNGNQKARVIAEKTLTEAREVLVFKMEMAKNKYQVRLDNFKGPLDLLLHLIEENKLDIYDIPIAQVVEQYLNYIHNSQQLNLDIAGEYLVMAATLLAIKARMLLPAPPATEEDEEEDPRQELVKKLIEYKKYKEAAYYLQDCEKKMSGIFVRRIDEEKLFKEFQPVNPVSNVSIENLMEHFQDILVRAIEVAPVYQVASKEILITECIHWILETLRLQPEGVSFQDLFNGSITRSHLVMNFLALLELIKQNKIKCRQDVIFGDIQIYLIENSG